MELSKKTTILLSPELHGVLTRQAEKQRTSLGDLVRTACEEKYCSPTKEEKSAALRRLTSLRLPVGTPRQIKMQSVPAPKELP